MTDRFFGESIRVVTGGELKQPETFWIGELEHTVSKVVAMWSDYGFGKVHVRTPRWFMRHHRTYYRVLTTSGEAYEMYYDRGVSLGNQEYKKWYLTRRLKGLQDEVPNAKEQPPH